MKMKLKIMTICAVLAAAAMVLGLAASAIAVPDASGSLVWTDPNSSSEIFATDGWADTDTQFSWDVTHLGVGLGWQYHYTWNVPEKNISHLIIETSTGTTLSNFWDFSEDPTSGDPQTYSPSDGNSNPGMPASIFGLKFGPGLLSKDVTFTSNKRPVWGSFYSKDGTDDSGTVDVYAYNIGLGMDETTVRDVAFGTGVIGYDFGAGLFDDQFIAVPDTKNGDTDDVVPEASTLCLGAMGLLAPMGYALKRRRVS